MFSETPSLEIQNAATSGLFLIFLLVIVFPHVIPGKLITITTTPVGQGVLVSIVFILAFYLGPMAGLFAALAFLFVWSLSSSQMQIPVYRGYAPEEGFQTIQPAIVFGDSIDSGIVPDKHKWYVEKVLKENPLVINEKTVNTSAVQDNSNSPMVNSRVSR
jgi:hypothetical protein